MTEKHGKNGKRLCFRERLKKIKNYFLKATCFALLPPLISCATFKKEIEQTRLQCKMNCVLNNEQIICSTNNKKLELDIPSNIDLNKENIIKTSYQAERTILITENYIIRTLGCEEIRNGKEILGKRNGTIYFQNAVFISIQPLKEMGNIKNIEIVDENVVFLLDNGVMIIVNSDKMGPAKVIGNAKN
ncbi:MAG: hypothetical protein QW153_03775 [Candidatus Bilamarchaeaceae archaeon]